MVPQKHCFQCRRAWFKLQPVLPLYCEKSQGRFASFEMGTVIGPHQQLAAGQSRGSCAGLSSTSGGSHMGWRPAFQPVGSPRLRGRQRPPRYPRRDALGPAPRRARKGNSPPSSPLSPPSSPQLRPHHGSRSASGARAPSSTPRGPDSRATRRSKVDESYGERMREATPGMRIALIQRGGVSVVTQETWAQLGAGPASRSAPVRYGLRR